MRKYYYYAYKNQNSYGCGCNYSDSGNFEIVETLKKLTEQYGDCMAITFFKEISNEEYEKFRKYFENQNK